MAGFFVCVLVSEPLYTAGQLAGRPHQQSSKGGG